jgi:hypothetical protein
MTITYTREEAIAALNKAGDEFSWSRVGAICYDLALRLETWPEETGK